MEKHFNFEEFSAQKALLHGGFRLLGKSCGAFPKSRIKIPYKNNIPCPFRARLLIK